MSSELKQKTMTALAWNFVEKFGQQIIYMLAGMVVARMVSPEQYGLFAVLAVFITFSTILSESGFTSTLIRKRDLQPIELSTVFLFNTGVSISIYLILFFCAPLIARFFNSQELIWVSRALFTSVIFYSSGLVQQVQLTKKLELHLLTKINLFALLVSSVISIFIAWLGYGVWALVAQNVGLAFIRMVMLWTFGKWGIRMRFRMSVLKDFFSFSSKLLLLSMMSAVVNNINGFVIGKFFPKADAGYYFNANKYQDIPGGIIANTFRTVLLPVISYINDEPERAKRVTSRVMGTLSVIIFPVMFLLIIIAKPFIVMLISEVWLPSVPIFQVLCVAGAFTPFTILFNEVFIGMGRLDIILIYEFVRKGMFFGVLFMIFNLGVMALAWLWVGYTIFSLLFGIYFMRKMLRYSLFDFLRDSALPMVTAGVLAVGLNFANQMFENMYYQMMAQSVVMGTLYFAILMICKEPNMLEAVGMTRARFEEYRSRRRTPKN